MPEAIVAAVVDAALAAGVEEATIAAIGEFIATYGTTLQVASAVYTLRSQQLRSERAARDAHNASLKDRYVMVRGTTEPRQMVLGRQRVSGPIGFIKSYGTKNEHLVYTVLLAAHEVDAIETIYFDDEPVVLDGSGNVTGIRRTDEFSIAAATGTFTISSLAQTGTVTAVAKYGTTTTTLTVTGVTGTSVSVSGASSSATGLLVITYQPDPCPFVPSVVSSTTEYFTPGANPATFTLASAPAGTVTGTQSTGTGIDQQDITVTASMAGLVATFTGVTPGVQCAVSYQSAAAGYRARVRKYLGAPGQAADSAMVSNLGGVWTSAHVGTGLAYLVVELDYDPDSFPGGIPNVSAVVRGLKCYDPRSGTTTWTENPALLMRAYAIHPLGGRQAATAIDDAVISTAATVCDTSINYVVGTATHTRATYTAGLVAKSGTRPSDVLNDLAQAMGGRWCMVDGTLKIRAGAYTAPVMALDASWLHEGGGVTVTPGRNRMDVINAVTGTFADEAADYKVLAYPKVIASAYVTTDGTELPTDMQMAGVTFTGQAQYIAACALRYARSALTVKMTCNLRAYQLEPFDVITVTLDRFGWSSKTFEVLDTSWTIEGGIELTLKAIDSSIWAIDSAYTAGVPAANTRLPSPWDIPAIAGLSAVSNSTTVQKQPDGSNKARILSSWTLVQDQRVTQGGSVELKWGLATKPEAEWQSVICAGGQTSAYLDPVHVGASYIVKARTVTSIAVSPWCSHVLCAVSNTSAFGGTVDFATGVTGSTKPANNATVNRVTYSSSAPGSPVDGDMWVDTSTAPYVIKVRVSGAWQTGANLSTGALAQLNSVDTAQIVAGAATGVVVATVSSFSLASPSHTPDGEAYRDAVVSITYTPSVTGDILISLSALWDYVPMSIFLELTGGINISGSWAAANDSVSEFVRAPSTGLQYNGSVNTTRRFSCTSGVSYTFVFLAKYYGTSDVVNMTNVEMRLEAIKR